MPEEHQPFSWTWVAFSVVVFVGVEILIGGFVAELVKGRYVSHMLHLKLQMVLNLGSYFLGGVAIGIVSPRIRVVEPAVGAFLSVAMVLMISFFLPYFWYGFTLSKLVVGGSIAFVLALAGAYSGEKLMGNVEQGA